MPRRNPRVPRDFLLFAALFIVTGCGMFVSTLSNHTALAIVFNVGQIVSAVGLALVQKRRRRTR